MTPCSKCGSHPRFTSKAGKTHAWCTLCLRTSKREWLTANPEKRRLAARVVASLVLIVASVFSSSVQAKGIDCSRHPKNPNCVTSSLTPTIIPSPTLTPTASPTPTPSPSPTATPSTPTPTPTPIPMLGQDRLLFGIGPEADGVISSRLYAEAPINMLTSWYNGPGDLGWMPGWEDDIVPQAYARGEALHLIVWTNSSETTQSTAYGAACGRTYPLSSSFLSDMQVLAHTFRPRDADDRLYVTLFTEFQTFACTDNAWNPNAQTNAYWQALKDRYVAARDVFWAVGGKVSLGWGGWQARFDNPAIGGGRSMFGYFADVMSTSDFQSFQAMQSDGNVADVHDMTAILDDYGPVMLAHYKPDNGSQTTFSTDIHKMLTDSYLTTVPGLFAWSFMDRSNMDAVESDYQFVKAAVQRYAGP